MTSELEKLAPNFTDVPDNDLDEILVQAIAQTQRLVSEIAHVSEAISSMNAVEASFAIYKGFSTVLDRYNLPSGFAGSFRKVDFDFYKFMGHELFVTFFSFLVREERWEMVADLLDENIYVTNNRQHYAGTVSFTHVSDYVELLVFRNQRLNTNRTSIHADILKERHTQGELGILVPIEQFIDADYFLFLRAELEKEGTERVLMSWRAWSTLYMKHQPPKFLAEATRIKYAQRLLRPLGVENIQMLRERLTERAKKLEGLFNHPYYSGWSHPLEDFDVSTIGAR